MLSRLTPFVEKSVEDRQGRFIVALLLATAGLAAPTALMIGGLITWPAAWWFYVPFLGLLSIPWFVILYLWGKAQRHAMWLFLHKRA